MEGGVGVNGWLCFISYHTVVHALLFWINEVGIATDFAGGVNNVSITLLFHRDDPACSTNIICVGVGGKIITE